MVSPISRTFVTNQVLSSTLGLSRLVSRSLSPVYTYDDLLLRKRETLVFDFPSTMGPQRPLEVHLLRTVFGCFFFDLFSFSCKHYSKLVDLGGYGL